jgi:ferredoxin
MRPSAPDVIATLRRVPLFAELSDQQLGAIAERATRKRYERDSIVFSEGLSSGLHHPRKDEAGFVEAPQLYIDPGNCICCGVCVPACPVTAIFLAEDIPLQWNEYVQTNAEWYASKNAPQST